MIVRIIYRESIRLRFFLEHLPYALRIKIDGDKYGLWKLAKENSSGPGAPPIREKFYLVEDRVYSVKFAISKLRQDAPDDEPVQDLLILAVEPVDDVHAIR